MKKITFEVPTLTVGMIQSRTGDMVDRAKRSVDHQILFEVMLKDFIIIDNRKKDKTIGHCYNQIAEMSMNDYIFYMDDDDIIATDYLLNLLLYAKKIDTGKCKLAGVTTFLTCFNEDDGTMFPVNKVPTGMLKREVVLKHKFDENLRKEVDSELYDRLTKAGYAIKNMYWNYAYLYRQHSGNVSGSLKLVGAN